jgi:DNA-binding CsgD family transcriptional regulator
MDYSNSEQIVFDVDIDGSRYILIRTASLERGVPLLSPREREIVRMVAQGRQNKVIANELHISAWTVSTHLRRIFTKLGVSSRAAMVAKASPFSRSQFPRSRAIDAGALGMNPESRNLASGVNKGVGMASQVNQAHWAHLLDSITRGSPAGQAAITNNVT